MRKNCHKATYYSWRCMRNRCNHANNASYKYYGAVGISYDSKWDSYDNFLADMGERPDGCTLDRIDNNQNYQKDNCKWSSHPEQMRNRKWCLKVTHDGVTKTSAEWSKDLGLTKGAVWNRIKLYDWSLEKAVTTPKAA